MLIISVPVFTQASTTKEERQLLKKGRKALANEDYKVAQEHFSNLVNLVPNNDLYNFEAGLSYYFADVEREKSVPYFEAALQNSKEDTIPELYYYLARAYHFSGEYEKSEDAFQKLQPFIYKNTGSGKALMKQADYYIQLNKTAAELEQKQVQDVKITNLGQEINSGYGEYAAVFGNVKDVILFTSRRPGSSSKTDKDLLPYEDVFVAKKVADDWKLITDEQEIEKYIPKRLNTKGHDASIIYSADGTTLYTYKNDIIWKSILENGKWSDLVELDKNINNSQYNIPSICLSRDGKTIYFVSTKKDGKGGKDIYTSTLDDSGKWTPAVNLGDVINTEFDEDSPFITADGKTLYFSSKGHTGIGGYDIFKSELVNGSWSTPENVGLPINSPVDDIYYIYDPEGQNGYFSSNRNGGVGGMDLYSFCFNCPDQITNTINGLVADADGNPVEEGFVSLLSATDTELRKNTLQSGKYGMSTETSGKHSIMVVAGTFQPQNMSLDLPEKSSTSNIDFTVSQFEKEGKTYQVLTAESKELGIDRSDTMEVFTIASALDPNNPNINIDLTGTPSLPLPHSEIFYFDYNNKELGSDNPKLVDFMNKVKITSGQSKITITIESSASRVPTTTYGNNSKLAKARAEAAKKTVESYLRWEIQNGQITIGKTNSLVSGPAYKNDSSDADKYREYQYVKISIR
ncbi:MAG: PD40 domain-containing protein [Flavobacteriales bacterium]|nr:PD40 domain-containing protein [Flavobacteriales bacterium]